MSPRDVQEPTKTEGNFPGEDESVEETHPAFGLARFNRQTSTPGSVLFDSEIRHGQSVTFSVSECSRTRGLNRDWMYPTKTLIELEMSEAQFGALVSSFGNGNGVPVTIRRKESDFFVPALKYEPRLALSTEEAVGTASKVFDRIREAAKAVEEKPTKANIRALMNAISGVEPNLKFAADSMTEHVENVVTKARADIEAMVANKASELGLTAADVPVFELPAAQDEGDVVDAEVVD